VRGLVELGEQAVEEADEFHRPESLGEGREAHQRRVNAPDVSGSRA
jgi:hypothetical protein